MPVERPRDTFTRVSSVNAVTSWPTFAAASRAAASASFIGSFPYGIPCLEATRESGSGRSAPVTWTSRVPSGSDRRNPTSSPLSAASS